MSYRRRKPGKWAVFVYESFFDRRPRVESRHATEAEAYTAMGKEPLRELLRSLSHAHSRWRSVHSLDRVRSMPDGSLLFLDAHRSNGAPESDVFG